MLKKHANNLHFSQSEYQSLKKLFNKYKFSNIRNYSIDYKTSMIILESENKK